MSEYLCKTPSVYITAAKFTKEVKENGSNIKRLVFSRKHPNIKALYALVSETLRHFKHIDYLIKKTKLVENNPTLNPWLLRVLITELLWGKKKFPMVNSRAIQVVLLFEQIFQKYLQKAEKKLAVVERVAKPRYIRINTLKISVNDAIQAFIDEGYTYKEYNKEDGYDNFLSIASSLGEKDFISDIHFKEVLLFSPNVKFYDHEAYINNLIILQDKASCIPAYLLNPIPGSTILDMCAAPGVKTTLLAALLNNRGTIYALDRDYQRYQELSQFVLKSGATCVKTFNKDTLDANSKDFPHVEYILVDPSCSGSGMLDRIEDQDEEVKIDYQRLKKLSGFQILILKHALRSFPNVKRVVYSTCSLYPQENEEVVREVLSSTENFKLVPIKTLINPWFNFGSSNYENIGEFCLYSRPEKDLTNGFFVAVFEKLEGNEVNPFFANKFLKKKSAEKVRQRKTSTKKENVEKGEENKDKNNEYLLKLLLRKSKTKKRKNKKRSKHSGSDRKDPVKKVEDTNEKDKHEDNRRSKKLEKDKRQSSTSKRFEGVNNITVNVIQDISNDAQINDNYNELGQTEKKKNKKHSYSEYSKNENVIHKKKKGKSESNKKAYDNEEINEISKKRNEKERIYGKEDQEKEIHKKKKIHNYENEEDKNKDKIKAGKIYALEDTKNSTDIEITIKKKKKKRKHSVAEHLESDEPNGKLKKYNSDYEETEIPEKKKHKSHKKNRNKNCHEENTSDKIFTTETRKKKTRTDKYE